MKLQHKLTAMVAGAMGILVLATTIAQVMASGALDTYRTEVRAAGEHAQAVAGVRSAFQTQVQEWKNVLLRGHEPERLRKHWASFETHEQRVREDVRLTITIDGMVTHLTARTARIQLDDEMAMAYVFRDITKVVEAEQMKADFHSMIAHDLRSPMSVIQGYVSLMATGKTGEMNETQVEFLDSVNRKITEMTALLNDFLDINKIDAGFVNLKREDMDLGNLCREVLDDLAPMAAGSALQVDLELPDAAVVVHADPLRMTQILRNLVSNAIKYNREGGWVRLSVETRGETVRVAVSDGGIGMSADELRVLFQPYTRGKSQRTIKGVGLGVVIIKKLVEAHGGQIEVRSEPDKGSTFRFTLPLVTAAADRETAAPPAVEPVPAPV